MSRGMSRATFPILVVAAGLIGIAALPAFAATKGPAIFVPRSETAAPILDGTWTNPQEWSKASETFVNYTDGTHLVVRAKHDLDRLYVLLEMPNDYVLDGRAGICFDTLKDGGPYMKSDDYCFVLGDALREYHGDGRSTLMYAAALNSDVTASRGLSGPNSPYEPNKNHVTYEFGVPLEYLGSDFTDYGFYVVFDTRGETTNYTYSYSWPDFESESSQRVISPRDWGQVVISSDVNVPEFPLPVVAYIAGAVGIVAILTRTIPSKSAKQ